MTGNRDVELIERAMVELRRSQSRRTLMRLATAAGDDGAPVDSAVFEVLDVVTAAAEKGESVGVREVALALNIDQPRASKLVAGAVAAQYLRREADQSDGRRTLLVMTPLGRRTSAELHDFRTSIVERVTAQWSDADRANFAALFGRFVTGMAQLKR